MIIASLPAMLYFQFFRITNDRGNLMAAIRRFTQDRGKENPSRSNQCNFHYGFLLCFET